MNMQKITPHLWFDREAKEAAEFYVSVFDDSRIHSINTLRDTPSGDTGVVAFQIMGYDFMAISAGPLFKINPSISFHVRCKTAAEVDRIWEELAKGGTVLMELGEYPFSRRYGWVQDKFGVSWQVIRSEGDFRQRIVPALMFVGDVSGRAEEAIGFYASVFPDATAEVLARYEKGEEPDKAGTVKFAQFILYGQDFGAMDSARMHGFGFNEGVSLVINCKDQQEIDYYWDHLSAVPEAEQCGWIKDKYDVSWQIVPANMGELIGRNPEKTTPVMLKMKKIVIADLVNAAQE
jgi:predicted 3-demethylubiquinone-9 3-methyltransferase (glyoxalase superfamily)